MVRKLVFFAANLDGVAAAMHELKNCHETHRPYVKMSGFDTRSE